MYADNPDGASKALVYGDVAVMFLFQGFYSIGWTPLLTLYPPEVLNFSIRANGVAGTSFALNAFALVFVFIMPIGLANITWKMYFVNGSWDIIILGMIVGFCSRCARLWSMANRNRLTGGLRRRGRRSRRSMRCLRAKSIVACRMWRWYGRGGSRLMLKVWRRRLTLRLRGRGRLSRLVDRRARLTHRFICSCGSLKNDLAIDFAFQTHFLLIE
jgi:hypothetical protein